MDQGEPEKNLGKKGKARVRHYLTYIEYEHLTEKTIFEACVVIVYAYLIVSKVDMKTITNVPLNTLDYVIEKEKSKEEKRKVIKLDFSKVFAICLFLTMILISMGMAFKFEADKVRDGNFNRIDNNKVKGGIR